ncbi:MAG TPA: hypothetical protein VLE25_08230 [Nitrospira sp.]|nr:hypothetical protein [Nitrospira sp.]
MTSAAWGLLFILFSGCTWIPLSSVHPISVGDIEFDPPTIHTVGISLPVLSGDENYDAAVRVFYRPAGGSSWEEALPLQRVRPDTLSRAVPSAFAIAEQFAGSIFDLAPDSAYEIRLRIEDPEGGITTRTAWAVTRAVPRTAPRSPHIVDVDSDDALAKALARAAPGDVITLERGLYKGPIRVERSGTVPDPIIVRGGDPQETVIESPGEEYGVRITGSHVHLENLTIRSSIWGVMATNASDVVIRRTYIHGVSYGINGRVGTNRNFYICDNVLEGNGVTWPDTSNRTWNYEGIVVTGAGHVICHNTLAGFGDALGLSQPEAIPNRAIDFYGNDVLWGGDDGIELDYSERNVRAFRNRFGNVAMGISFQPVWGGPVYAVRNVIYNTAIAPYKLNQEPSGFFILHNTSIRPGWAWLQYGNSVSNFSFHNNLTIGTGKAVYVTPYLHIAGIDYNGWSPDGEFKFDYSWAGFGSLSQESPYERHGRLLTAPVFRTAIVVPPKFEWFMPPPPAPILHAQSNAVDAGLRLPNINDHYTGERPDMGALERGRDTPSYGVRWRAPRP